jgi:hypothetical protein
MNEQQPDNQENKVLPGTLIDSIDGFSPPHHESYNQRHALGHPGPSLVEVRSNLF